MKDEAAKFLVKADHALHAAEILIRDGDYESAAGRCYYAMLHAAQALLRERDFRYRKHTKYHRWLLDAFDDRQRGDYDIDVSFDPETVTNRIDQARDFIAGARRHLGGASP